MGDRKTQESRIIWHTPEHEAGAIAKRISGYWARTAGTLEYMTKNKYEIHAWDNPRAIHMEICMLAPGSGARTILMFDVDKVHKTVPLYFVLRHSFFSGLDELAKNFNRLLVNEFGFNPDYSEYDLLEYERRFNSSCPLLLDELGRRLDTQGNVLLDDSSKTFGLVHESLVEYLI